MTVDIDPHTDSSGSRELLAKGQWKWGDIAGSDYIEESGRKGKYPEHLALIYRLGTLLGVQRLSP